MSDTLHANAAMMASIAFLIVFAVVGAVMKYLEQTMLDESYRFGVTASVPSEGAKGSSLTEEMKTGKMCVVADLEEGRYDAQALYDELSYETAVSIELGKTVNMVQNIFGFKEKARQERYSVTAVIIVEALYLSVVFAFLSMAELAGQVYQNAAWIAKRNTLTM